MTEGAERALDAAWWPARFRRWCGVLSRRVWLWVVDGGVAPLVLGLALVAVPTIFTLFAPELVAPSGPIALVDRVIVGLVWVGAAVIALCRQGALDGRAARLLSDRLGRHEEDVEVAVDEVLGALVHPGTQGTPDHYQWAIFVYDDLAETLQPMYPAVSDAELPVLSFRPGNGATGRAFEDGGVVVVQGDAVSNAEYRLTPEQQGRFAAYRTVVAARMSWQGRRTGTLSAISDRQDDYFLTAEGRAVILRLSETLSAVLAVMLGIDAGGQ